MLLRTLFALLLLASAVIAQEAAPPVAPVAPTRAYGFDFHGRRIEDPYFWMKDKADPEVIT